jgi:hypothetical protein
MAHIEPSCDIPFGWPDYTAVQQGWQCPVCRRVYSPSMVMCSYCPAQPVTSTGANHQPTVDFIAKGHLGTPCPKPRDGGMCGCDEDDLAGPRDCYQGRCSC